MHRLEKIMRKVMEITFWSGLFVVAVLGLLMITSGSDCDTFSCARNAEAFDAWAPRAMLWVGVPLIGISGAIFLIGFLIFREE